MSGINIKWFDILSADYGMWKIVEQDAVCCGTLCAAACWHIDV